jgi:hypothetical protein
MADSSSAYDEHDFSGRDRQGGQLKAVLAKTGADTLTQGRRNSRTSTRANGIQPEIWVCLLHDIDIVYSTVKVDATVTQQV